MTLFGEEIRLDATVAQKENSFTTIQSMFSFFIALLCFIFLVGFFIIIIGKEAWLYPLLKLIGWST